MAGISNNTQWSPGTPPVAAADLSACPVLVVHYWAPWDFYDREMDKQLTALRDQYAEHIRFRSCDVDRPGNQPFIQGITIANVPALGCFLRGKWHKSLIGMRSEAELRTLLDGWLAAAAETTVYPE